jgi:hypothetical protein
MRSVVKRNVVMRRIPVLRYQRLTSVCRDSAVGTALRWGLDGPGFETWKGQEIFSFSKHPNRLCDPPSLLFNGYGGSILWVKCVSVKLTTHLHPVPRLRMSAATPLFLSNYDYDKHRRQWMLLNKLKEMKQLFEWISKRLLKLLIPVFRETFLLAGPFLVSDPHTLAHANTDCLDDRYRKLKICISELILDSY